MSQGRPQVAGPEVSRLATSPSGRCGRDFGLAALVVAMSFFVLAQPGFRGHLFRDFALYLYGGERMVAGVPPYVSTFDIKGPVPPMLTALGVLVAHAVRWDDLFTVRFEFLLLAVAVVFAIYLLARWLLQSRTAGLFAAATALCFPCFTRYAASGPEAKQTMLLFMTLSILFTSTKRWFWAGVAGALAALSWQPTGIFPVISLVLAAATLCWRNLARAAAGIALAGGGISAYFLWHGAFGEMIDGLFLFHLRYLHRDRPTSLKYHLFVPIKDAFRSVWAGGPGDSIFILVTVIGLLMFLYFYVWRRSLHANARETLTKDAFAPLFLSLPILLVWTAIDYSGCPDSYLYLPYIALGFGGLLHLAVEHVGQPPKGRHVLAGTLLVALVGTAAIDGHLAENSALEIQRQRAQELLHRFGANTKIVSVGVPEILVLLHRVNPTPYDFINDGVDRRMEATIPGGFDGWIQQLQTYDPDIVVFCCDEGKYMPRLMQWLEGRYQEETIRIDEYWLPWQVWSRQSQGSPKRQP